MTGHPHLNSENKPMRAAIGYTLLFIALMGLAWLSTS